MPETEVIQNEAPPAPAPLPSWVGEISRTQRLDIRSCIPFPLRALEGGAGWAWQAERTAMTAAVKFGDKRNSLVITVSDDEAGEVIELWTTELQMTGQWKRRLRQASGEALVLCQSRHPCPKCNASVKLIRRRQDSVQFFGCPNYRSAAKCNGSLNIIDHDVERAV